jgi:hypothetical protein
MPFTIWILAVGYFFCVVIVAGALARTPTAREDESGFYASSSLADPENEAGKAD